jgi:alanine racemase
MNILMVDVTDVGDVEVGEEIVLIGTQSGARVSAEELAEHAGTINYELLARLAPSTPRYLRHDAHSSGGVRG